MDYPVYYSPGAWLDIPNHFMALHLVESYRGGLGEIELSPPATLWSMVKLLLPKGGWLPAFC